MSEQVARAVGAGSSLTLTIAGKQCTPRPLGVRELVEVERDCLDRYRRDYLEAYVKNLDLLPEAARETTLARKLEEVARWDTDCLPAKDAHDSSRVKLTDSLREWAKAYWALAADDAPDTRIQRLVAAALDQDILTAEKYQELTQTLPPRIKVPYVNWWITGSFVGMITMLWVCFRQEGITREQVIDALASDMAKLNETAREIEKLSAPQAGNG